MVDIAGDNSTTSTVTVGSTVTNAIETGGDHDWFAINLTAGQSISVALNGIGASALEDPLVRIRNASGTIIFEDDDSGSGRNALVAFQATYSGIYYIDVAAWDEVPAQYNYTGDYQLVVNAYQQPPVATMAQIANQLTHGFWNGESQRFAVSPGGSLTVNVTGLTSAGQGLAREALRQWTDIIGVSFVEVGSGGQIVFDDNEAGASSGSVTSGGVITSSNVNISTAWLADHGTSLDGYSFQTYLHEVGHALGLGHAGNYDGEARFPFDALFLNDAWSTTVMSYFSPTDNSYFAGQGFTQSYLGTPMVADILAMSVLYGLSTTTRSGDTVYGFNSTAGNSVYNATNFSTLAYTVFDSGGADTLDYSGFSSNQTIDLNAGAFSNVGNRVGNVAIALGTIIENAIGGGGDDKLIGNAANNVLNGGNGTDSVSYATASAGVTVNLGLTGGQNTGGAGTDTLTALEILIGSSHADRLTAGAGRTTVYGGTGNDTLIATFDGDALYGDAGDDTFIGGAGSDTFNGDAGYDTADYSASGAAVRVGPGYDGGANGLDLLASVERIIGSNFDDQLRGAEVIVGGAGNDLIGNFSVSGHGGAGNDTYDVNAAGVIVEAPNEGIDLVRTYSDYILPQNVENLALLHSTDPNAGATVAVPNPVNGTGNALDNGITGNMFANRLSGLAGADTLTGGAGADTLTGGSGNDTFRDTLEALNGDTITDFAPGDRIIFVNANLASFSYTLDNAILTFTGGSLAMTGASGTLYASAAAGGGVQLNFQAPRHDADSDFNGDGRSDILWRNADGRLTDWLSTANGGYAPNSANLDDRISTDWRVAETGDFNGDGRDDIMWRNLDGRITNWLGTATGGFADNIANAYNDVAVDWKVAGVGDFNGDGRDDILWRNLDGRLTDWLSTANGGYAPNSAHLNDRISTDWRVEDIGDFNGDGRDDIMWRNDDGRITNWLGTATGGFADNIANAYNDVAIDWKVAGVGDFNGDGRDDILWRNVDGRLTDWLSTANGGYAPNSNLNQRVSTDWQVDAIGDYNGDGRDDIMWRHSDGRITNWLGTDTGGFSDNIANAYNAVSNDWQVQPADFLF